MTAVHPGLAMSPINAELFAAKQAKGLTFADLEQALGRDEVWIAALFYGQASASIEEASRLVELLGVDDSWVAKLTEYPVKASIEPDVPRDPLIYRLYEIVQVYGRPMKDVIQEKFGDGIMSAIDFSLNIDKIEDPKGDRVLVTMNGKFLPYRKW